MFITFEGPEGAGKSTQIASLKRYLTAKGFSVVSTREPGGSEFGKRIRDFLLKTELDNLSEIFLFMADRAQHVSRIILPALSSGKIVISDRFTDSTLAYQIGGRGLPEDLVRYLIMVSTQGLVPDLTILLDVPSELGLKRAGKKGRRDRFEKEKLAFHRRVRAKYLELAKHEPQRIKVVSSENKKVAEVGQEIKKIVKAKLDDKQ